MKMQQPNQFSSAGRPVNRPIPGLKVAYGSQAQQSIERIEIQARQSAPVQRPQLDKSLKQVAPDNRKGLFSRITEGLFNMVTEEVPVNERPIGISQLSRTTFQAAANRQAPAFFKNSQPIQDYRFNQLVTSPFHKPRD